MMNKKLILVRGLPGSGKSTLAKKIIKEVRSRGLTATVIEADMYFTNQFGKYKWSGDYIYLAHQWCFAQCVRFLMIMDLDVVCIANTFTQLKEMQKYIDFAKENNIELEVIEPDTPWSKDIESCFSRNTHNVPKEVIQKMMDRWEKYDVVT